MHICLVEFHSPALPPTMYVQKASHSTIQLDSTVVQAPSWQGGGGGGKGGITPYYQLFTCILLVYAIVKGMVFRQFGLGWD